MHVCAESIFLNQQMSFPPHLICYIGFNSILYFLNKHCAVQVYIAALYMLRHLHYDKIKLK